MILNIIFVLTLGIVILNLLFVVSLFGKHTLTLPELESFSPKSWYLFYPAFFYQVWWWSNYFNLLTI